MAILIAWKFKMLVVPAYAWDLGRSTQQRPPYQQHRPGTCSLPSCSCHLSLEQVLHSPHSRNPHHQLPRRCILATRWRGSMAGTLGPQQEGQFALATLCSRVQQNPTSAEGDVGGVRPLASWTPLTQRSCSDLFCVVVDLIGAAWCYMFEFNGSDFCCTYMFGAATPRRSISIFGGVQ